MKREKSIIVSCPNCNAPVVWSEASRHRPFCSKRCQLIDLGEWAEEEKRIPSTPRAPTDDYSDG